MKKPGSVEALTNLGRIRLSRHFFVRDMLHSEVGEFHGIPNIPDNPTLAVKVGKRLCEELLEPLHTTFGHVSIRSAFRCTAVNDFCNKQAKLTKKGYTCASTDWNRSRHVWDMLDDNGHMGATACIVIPWFVERYEAGTPWQAMAWWIHDNLPYSDMAFYPKYAAFNLRWHEEPARRIESHIPPGPKLLTKPGMPNHDGDHSSEYPGFPRLRR